MSDPMEDAFKSLHNHNLAAAAEARADNQAKTIAELRYAGNQLARVMEDILGSDMITCQISRAVMTASLTNWKKSKTGQ